MSKQQPDRTVDLSFADRIDLRRDQFEAELIEGGHPSIELYLQGFGGSDRALLFSELLKVEVEYRRQQGESLRHEDYVARFSDYGSLIEKILDDSLRETLAAQGTHVRHSRPHRSSFGDGRYLVKSRLGAGGQKEVFLAHDSQLDREVVVAVLLREVDSVSLELMLREARAMARMDDHPNIVSVYGIGEEDGQPYMIVQYVRGGSVEDLRSRGDSAPLAIREALRIAAQTCQALEHAHNYGIVHRDVKPANIWLTEDGTAKLGDFGIATVFRQASGPTGVAGTVAYMPPEQFGGGDASPQGDLYSLGVMLYETVAGRRPFVAGDLKGLMDQHLSDGPEPPSRHNPDIPPALDALILRLLAKDATERPESAAAVRAAIVEIELELDAQDSTEDEHTTASPLIGRQGEMDQLRAGVEEAIAGRGQVVLVAGEPGSGKTRLADELCAYARRRKLTVLRGQCSQSSQPAAFEPWIQAITKRIAFEAAEKQSTDADVTQGDAILAQMADLLDQATGQAPADLREARFRSLDAISTALCQFAREQSLLIVIDDLHWADEPSLGLLHLIASRIRDTPLFFLGTHWDVTLGRSHPLTRTLADLARERLSRRIRLSPLSRNEVANLLRTVAGCDLPDWLTEAVWQRAEGNPYFTSEIAHQLQTSGTCKHEQEASSEQISITETMRQAIESQLGLVSVEGRGTLVLAASIGRDFSLDSVEGRSRLPGDEVVDHLEEAVAAGILRELAGGVNVQYSFAKRVVYDLLCEESAVLRPDSRAERPR